MIPRYESKEIAKIWTDQHKFETYMKVELSILEAIEPELAPAGTAKKIKAKALINPQRIEEIEKIVHHDIIAFCTSVTENLDPEVGRFFHFGVTSSDIIDTSLTLQIKESLEIILPSLKRVCDVLLKKSTETKHLLAMGRSHGMYAEPLSFGQKLLGHYSEFKRRLKDLERFYQEELTGQFSGAVGNYTVLNPEQEKKALKTLGLNVEPLSTQVIPRDRLAKLISIHALIASAIERLAVEIRHLHRSEVAELYEGFSKGQKGSSTMPHKKNPISGENLTGMARILKSHLSIALDNVVLWHERDISHSSTERIYLPDNFGLLDYALNRLEKTISNLVILEQNVQNKVENNFIYLSSYYLHHLLKKSKIKREDLYEVIQKAAFEAKTKDEFYQVVKNLGKEKGADTSDLPSPSLQELKAIYLGHVDELFKRVQES